ncbi:Glucose-repressible alcohol dehydrogenase transcriptional effector [Cryptotrichosporon argae]
MFYPQSASSKHDPASSGPTGPSGSGPNDPLSRWGRHPFGPGVPLASPGYQGGLLGASLTGSSGTSGFGANGGSGAFANAGHLGHGHAGGVSQHHQHAQHPHHLHQQLAHHGPHHPSFGSSAGGGGGGQNGLVFAGGGGMVYGGGVGGGMGGVGGGMGGFMGAGASPPREREVPMTPHWQHQLLKAEVSRQASMPHSRARNAAVTSRLTKNAASSAVTIADPNRAVSASTNGHRKTTSSPPSDATPGFSHADPMNPEKPPVSTVDDEYAPWSGIDMGGIKLRALSPALFCYTHLTHLYVNHNALTSLPPAIGNLRQLQLLDATDNQLTAIPPEVGLLCKLKELLLFDNNITTIPGELGTLYNLETLGIDGNPLEERFRKLLAEEGTSALVAHLRDNYTGGPAPPERQWIEVEPDLAADDTESFTVLTYNILCHSFAPSSSYGYTPAWALDWQYRKQTILTEITTASADVVCLQEIASEQFADFFQPQLKAAGYEGSHYSRTRARTMAQDDAKMVDGCATFWKADKFRLVETQVIEFNQVALQRSELRTDDMFNRVLSRDNIGTTCALEFRRSGARVMVANAHIYWDHKYRDVKLVQIGMFMEKLEEIVASFAAFPPPPPSGEPGVPPPPMYSRFDKGRDIPLILCVDLNSLASSAVYEYISSGELAGTHADFMTHRYGPYTDRGLKHGLGLRSACASFGEMRMTNFTPTFDEAIDYIFYSPRSLKVTSVLGDVERNYLDRVVGFPNAHFPSDHIPVFAQFRVRPTAER